MARNKYPEETIRLILGQSLKLFMEKGYEGTSVQDIINQLGGLSKGAIYHHFKSKEEIFEAVCQKIADDNAAYYDEIRDDQTKNGIQKLAGIIKSAYQNPTNDATIAMASNAMLDPKFLSNHIADMFEIIAPQYVQPMIEEGIRDGSIQTEYPKELAEVLITLLNVWMNPLVVKITAEQMRRKVEFLSLLLKGMGLDLFNQVDFDQYVELCQRFNQVRK